MKLFIYDKTLDGLLCCVFFAYEHKIYPDYIVADTAQRPLLMEACYSIKTDTAKSKRVWRRLEEKLSKIAQNMLLLVWLSELPEVEMLLFRYICKMVDHPKGFEMNFGDEDVVRVKEIAEKVAGESRQMIQFVRFQQTTDNVYFAPIAPRFNILSLIASHFEERYANQQWIVYDTKRNLGLYYDKLSVRYVSFSEEDFEGLRRGKVEKEKLSDEELFYQELWREYFKSTTIRERINLSLQRRHMPKRYWRYLTEIQ